MRYFGLDWIAILCSLGALGLLSSKNRYGFALFLVANVCWLLVGHLAGSVAIMLGNIVFFGINFRGLIRWKRAARDDGKYACTGERKARTDTGWAVRT